jgi:hypothetical protein
VSGLPARLWHLAVVGWPWLAAVAVVVVVLAVATGLARRMLWARAARRGYWVAITPPRTIDPARYAAVWRVLHGLAGRARGGRWRLVGLPLAFEVYADRGRLTAGLWLPGWVPFPVAASSVARAWPGSTVRRATPPTLGNGLTGGGGVTVGYRLAPDGLHPETGWLVDDPATRTRTGRAATGPGMGGDPELGGVWAALSEPGSESSGPVLLQVLIRPATGRRRAALRRAARRPVTARRSSGLAVDGLLWLVRTALRLPLAVADLFLPSGPPSSGGWDSAGRPARPGAVDALAREAMRDAGDKARDTPHLLVSIRAVAARRSRWAAREAARQVADGFGEASRALWPVRLHRPATAVRRRWAGGGAWLLVSGSELGMLAHLPADPAYHGFDTAALHRPAPVGARRAEPERATRRGPGWTRRGWTTPPDHTDQDE